jgi:hypothetical protein
MILVNTGKLHFAIGMHASWNIMQNVVFGAPNSGKDPVASVWVFENQGPELWTGGNFGPEGGLLCTIMVGIGIGVLYLVSKNRSQKILNTVNIR